MNRRIPTCLLTIVLLPVATAIASGPAPDGPQAISHRIDSNQQLAAE